MKPIGSGVIIGPRVMIAGGANQIGGANVRQYRASTLFLSSVHNRSVMIEVTFSTEHMY
jgi:hypothetical protein